MVRYLHPLELRNPLHLLVVLAKYRTFGDYGIYGNHWGLLR